MIKVCMPLPSKPKIFLKLFLLRVTFVLFLSSDNKITNTTDILVFVFYILPRLTFPLDHQGLFPLMPHLPIIETREGLVLTRIIGHDMVVKTGGF